MRGTYESAWDDDHEPARLLLTDVLQRHAIRGAPVVMVPGRNKLLFTGDQDDAGIALLVRRAEHALSQPRSMSPLMLRLVEGKWTKLEPAAHAAKLHSLRLVSEGQAYANQKQLLDERSTQQGKNIFVANYMAGRGPDGTLGWSPSCRRRERRCVHRLRMDRYSVLRPGWPVLRDLLLQGTVSRK